MWKPRETVSLCFDLVKNSSLFKRNFNQYMKLVYRNKAQAVILYIKMGALNVVLF